MHYFEDLLRLILSLLGLGALAAGPIYVLVRASEFTGLGPTQTLRTLWCILVRLLTCLMLGFLALGASFVSLLLADDHAGYIGAGWIVVMPLLWVAGALALVVLEKAGRVAPYLFAATGLAYVFLIKQIFLVVIGNGVGSPVLLISLPLLAAYCLAVGVVLQGLIAPAPDKAVWRLGIEALICLASGSVMIIPLVILSNGGGYEALFAVLVWSGTILSVWSLGNAALLTAGRTGAIGPFLMLSFVVYVGVVVALIEAAGEPNRLLGGLTLVALNCGAPLIAWRFLLRTPEQDSDTSPALSPAS